MSEKDFIHAKIEKAKMLVLISGISGVGSFILALVVIFPGLVYGWAGVDVYSLILVPYMMAGVFGISALIYGLLASKAAHEEEEKQLLARRKDRTFEDGEDVRFTTGRTFSNYRKYAPYIISSLAALIIAVALVLYWRSWSSRVEAPIPSSALHTAFVSTILMCVSLFAGAFCIGQSRIPDFRWLRPVGAWLVAGFLSGLMASLAALMHKFGYPGTDYHLRNILFVFYIILGAEFVINFISEFYRPRTIEEERPIFESRLLALFTEPGGVVRNIADTLDYQFGFKVSKTWIYTFFERSLVPLLILWLFTLWLFTCICEVGPNEIGIRERFGKIVSDKPIPPGVHFKLPFPFGNISRFKVDLIQEVVIGPDIKHVKNGKKDNVVLWTQGHYAKESRFVVASEAGARSDLEDDASKVAPVSFLSVSLPVQFKIKPEKIIDYAYKNRDPKIMLKSLGEMVATKYLASVDMLNIMSTGREAAAKELKKLIQQAADAQGLGIEIMFVNFHDAHPPVGKVSEAFQDVIGAREEKQTLILAAKSYCESTIPVAQAEGVQIKYRAQAYKDNAIKVSEAESERFNKQLFAYKEMPYMFKLRTYLDFLENDCKKMRKYVVSGDIPYEIYEINLEQKTRFDLLDVDLGDISSGK